MMEWIYLQLFVFLIIVSALQSRVHRFDFDPRLQ